MELQQLREILSRNPETYEYREAAGGLYIVNRRFGTEIHATYEAIAANDWLAIKAQSVAGRDVLHITRVTGYFTFVEGWNQGKIGELRDRNRATIKEGS